MNINDSYKRYAADCVRLADGEASPEAKHVMLNIALCWVKLAQQKQAVASVIESSDDAPHQARPVADAPAKSRTH